MHPSHEDRTPPGLAWRAARGRGNRLHGGAGLRAPGIPTGHWLHPETAARRRGHPEGVVGGDSQRIIEGQDIPAQWWELFHSPALNAVVERALSKNPDLKAAEAALAVAHENVLVQRAAYYPSATGSLAAGRSKTSAELAPTPNSGALLYSLYTSQVSVAFTPDVFGLNRRLVESLQAQEQESRFQLEAARLALSANVVLAAIQEAALRAQISATQALIDLDERSLAVLRQQKARGYAGQLDVLAQEAQLTQARAALPPLLKQLTQQRDLLAALSAAYPSEGLPEQFELSQLQLPGELPLSLPSRLVEQRPDIRQAEENLHMASPRLASRSPVACRISHSPPTRASPHSLSAP